MASKIVNNMVEAMERVRAHLRRGENVRPYIQLCATNLLLLNNALEEAKGVGERSKLQAAICRMLGYRTFFESLEIRGGGVQEEEDRIRWHDVQSAFTSRIRTGCIVNLRHVDPRSFLDDTRDMITERIAEELKKVPFLKINAVFTGRFKVQDRVEFKHIATRNRAVNIDTNLGGWYDEYIKRVILRELEEFQVS